MHYFWSKQNQDDVEYKVHMLVVGSQAGCMSEVAQSHSLTDI